MSCFVSHFGHLLVKTFQEEPFLPLPLILLNLSEVAGQCIFLERYFFCTCHQLSFIFMILGAITFVFMTGHITFIAHYQGSHPSPFGHDHGCGRGTAIQVFKSGSVKLHGTF